MPVAVATVDSSSRALGSHGTPPSGEDDDEDEEWGEMVASPPSTSRPVSVILGNGNLALARPPAAPTQDTSVTLNAVSSRLQPEHSVGDSQDNPAVSPSNDLWDLSAFDAVPEFAASATKGAPSSAVTGTSAFDFPVLQSAAPTTLGTQGTKVGGSSTRELPVAQNTASQVHGYFHRLPVVNGSAASTVSATNAIDEATKPPLALQTLSPAPLPTYAIVNNSVTTPIASLSTATNNPAKSVSFAPDEEDDQERLAVKRVTDALPKLAYMWR
jgi:hypothetical protein